MGASFISICYNICMGIIQYLHRALLGKPQDTLIEREGLKAKIKVRRK